MNGKEVVGKLQEFATYPREGYFRFNVTDIWEVLSHITALEARNAVLEQTMEEIQGIAECSVSSRSHVCNSAKDYAEFNAKQLNHIGEIICQAHQKVGGE